MPVSFSSPNIPPVPKISSSIPNLSPLPSHDRYLDGVNESGQCAGGQCAACPDALSLSPRAPVIETMKGKRVFDDGAHRVELYEFSNPHCAEMVIAWLPKEKILLEADMLDITYPGHIGEGGEDTAALLGKIQELGLGRWEQWTICGGRSKEARRTNSRLITK
jgi:hypothetical protein